LRSDQAILTMRAHWLLLVLCIALVFLAAVVVASDDGAEVVDLGRLGENTGRRGKASTIRRGGSFLSTEGSFTMSQGRFQGNNEEDELGERDASSEDAYGQTDIDELGDSEEHDKEIVGKLHRKHKSQLKLGETLKAAVEAKLGTQVPITKSIQKIIDDVADELSRTCAATALSAGKGPKEKTSAADSNLTTATTNKNAKGPAGDVAQHKGGGTFDWTQCKSEVSCSRACSALRHHTLLLSDPC